MDSWISCTLTTQLFFPDSLDSFQDLINRVSIGSEIYVLKINLNKIKFMVIKKKVFNVAHIFLSIRGESIDGAILTWHSDQLPVVSHRK